MNKIITSLASTFFKIKNKLKSFRDMILFILKKKKGHMCPGISMKSIGNTRPAMFDSLFAEGLYNNTRSEAADYSQVCSVIGGTKNV